MLVEIRPLQKEDALISYQWRNDPEVWKYTGSKPNIKVTPEIELQWIETVLQRIDEKRFAILADSKYIGNIQLTAIKEASADFHIFIGDKNYWGLGIATKAMTLLLNKAKNDFNLKKLFLQVNVHNPAAIHLYIKFGFVPISSENNIIEMEKIL